LLIGNERNCVWSAGRLRLKQLMQEPAWKYGCSVVPIDQKLSLLFRAGQRKLSNASVGTADNSLQQNFEMIEEPLDRSLGKQIRVVFKPATQRSAGLIHIQRQIEFRCVVFTFERTDVISSTFDC